MISFCLETQNDGLQRGSLELLVPKFQNILIAFEFKGAAMQWGGQRNDVLAFLPTGLRKSLIFQLSVITVEMECCISCLALVVCKIQ